MGLVGEQCVVACGVEDVFDGALQLLVADALLRRRAEAAGGRAEGDEIDHLLRSTHHLVQLVLEPAATVVVAVGEELALVPLDDAPLGGEVGGGAAGAAGAARGGGRLGGIAR